MNSPEIRLFVGPCRSGTAAFLNSMTQAQEVFGLFQPIKQGLREQGSPNYSVYAEDQGIHPTMLENPGKVCVIQETLGPDSSQEANLQVFPSRESIARSKPIFTLRSPFETWRSWKKWWNFDKSHLGVFEEAYTNVYRMFQDAKNISAESSCLAYEYLRDNPEAVMPLICERWGIRYTKEVIVWQKNFKDNKSIFFTDRNKQRIKMHGNHENLNDSAAYGKVLEVERPALTVEEYERIKKLYPLYEEFFKLGREYYPN